MTKTTLVMILCTFTALAVPVSRKSQTVMKGQIRVKARSYADFKVVVDEKMRDAALVGSFSASGGAGNDVDAAVVPEDDYPNWVNGHKARVIWTTDGKKTTAKFNVRLSPGTFYFYIGNTFSALTDKHVYIDATLNWTPLEE